jgi:2,3-bisphosphoglycerate-independent phosphoglycerate mutase
MTVRRTSRLRAAWPEIVAIFLVAIAVATRVPESGSFPGEDRVLIPSPKEVATYDQKPEMSAFELTERAVELVKSSAYDVIVLNYANPDMVGHTGSYEAAVKALEVVDRCLGDFLDAVLDAGGVALVIADHGNVEDLRPGAAVAHTYHSLNRVPCVLVGKDLDGLGLQPAGVLANVAPTLLELLRLPKPKEMDQDSLIVRI